jgi:hypothetical protein
MLTVGVLWVIGQAQQRTPDAVRDRHDGIVGEA